MPAVALNLINLMKLHVNGKTEDRKKKEQESAEAISGLKTVVKVGKFFLRSESGYEFKWFPAKNKHLIGRLDNLFNQRPVFRAGNSESQN